MIESKHHRRYLAAILLVYVLLAGFYSVTVPIYEAPDELQHAFYAKHLADGKGLPVLDPATARLWHEEGFPPRPYEDVWAQEGGQPPLYYALGALLISGVDTQGAEGDLRLNPHANLGNPLLPGNKNRLVHTSAEAWPWQGMVLAVHLLRWWSLILGAGTIILTYAIARDTIPTRPGLALATAALVAFTPQFIFISAAVSNDNLIIFLATLVIYVLVRQQVRATAMPRVGVTVFLGVLLALAALSKLSGLSLILIVTLAYLIQAWRFGRWRHWLVHLFGMGVLFILLAGWWYLRNWQLYGDPMAFSAFLMAVGERPRPLTWSNLRPEFQGLRISLFGLFGWFNLPLPDPVYTLWDLLLAIVSLGWIRLLWQRRQQLAIARILATQAPLLLLAAWLVILSLSLFRWTSWTPATQGRLLFPGIAALHLFILLGWQVWFPRWRGSVTIPPVTFLIIALLVPFWVISPAYRTPETIDAGDIPATARIAPLLIADSIELLGVAVEPDSVRAGERVSLSLYWQARTAPERDASLFVHLLGPGEVSLADLNTYPGWGSYPTTLWSPGEVIVDHYQLPAPYWPDLPLQVKVDVGLFDYETKASYSSEMADGTEPPLGQATLRLLPPPQTEPKIVIPLRADFEGGISLLGYDISPQVSAGDILNVRLFWQAQSAVGEDYQVFVHLLDQDGQRVTGYDRAPKEGWWPTSAWEPQEPFVDLHPLPLPADLTPGNYQLITGLYRLADLGRLEAVSQEATIRDRAVLLTTIEVRP